MHALIVHCHPEPKSFNGALTRIARETLEAGGATVEIADLYADGFDPVEGPRHYEPRADTARFAPLTEQRHASENDSLPADVAREIDRLERADLVILQFPLWWHAQPAMMKGWFDRVFVYGGLYTGSRRYDAGHFRGRRAMLSVTTGGPARSFTHYGRGGAIERLLWPIHYSLYYMGFGVLAPFLAHGIQGGGIAYQADNAFRTHLEDTKARWAERLRRLDDSRPIPFTGWSDWTDGVLDPEHPQRWA
ncbi:NAD(P)H-dependent oxidoreductase [Salinisphaera sp.]|uniref:NAD(P)H-dependent oxidoreductase n=1 Tax=Salinisphaera sp. TaxID=1914330 RepID=UPI002D776218|nr:NAD(P)H-dependent oxidoreductase [Salinisphaera sp.]HET7314477.1 NAD(P)H-dependent oxidoreductase [Salinisphaera sp.]